MSDSVPIVVVEAARRRWAMGKPRRALLTDEQALSLARQHIENQHG